MSVSLVLLEDDSARIVDVCQRLTVDASARAVFLIEKDGQLIASAGDHTAFDSTSLASLTAGNMAATDGLAKLLGESGFGSQFHEGERENINISSVGNRMMLVVIFDERSSLGLVRLRVEQATHSLLKIVRDVLEKSSMNQGIDFDMTDTDIDRMLGDD